MAQQKKLKLPVRQQKFCEYYVETGNATDSARRAGYKESSCAEQAYNLKQSPKVQQYIEFLLKQQQRRTQTDADKIVEELAMVGFANIQDYYNETGALKDLKSLSPAAAAAIKTVKETEHRINDETVKLTREFVLHDKLRSLEMLGNHFRIFDKDSRDAKDKELNVNITIKKAKSK